MTQRIGMRLLAVAAACCISIAACGGSAVPTTSQLPGSPAPTAATPDISTAPTAAVKASATPAEATPAPEPTAEPVAALLAAAKPITNEDFKKAAGTNYFKLADGCAIPLSRDVLAGSKLTASQLLADRWAACLDGVLTAWVAYAQHPDDAARNVFTAAYGYASAALGPDWVAYARPAVEQLDSVTVASDPTVVGTRSAGSLRTANGVGWTATKMHVVFRDALARNAASLATAIGSSCSSRCRGIMDVSLGDTQADADESGEVTPSTPIGTCQLYHAECELAGIRVWHMYQVTGDDAFYQLAIALRDLPLGPDSFCPGTGGCNGEFARQVAMHAL